MPLGFESKYTPLFVLYLCQTLVLTSSPRFSPGLNERRRRPNKCINFITVLDGPDKEIAQDFLERIAAIVYPIMRVNGLAVMSLDEFPPK